jgi:hypothetical protein
MSEPSTLDIERTRRRNGYALLYGAFASALAFIVASLCLLEKVAPPDDQRHDRFVLVRLAAHAVITVAGVFFFYQVAKLGERMATPAWLRQSEGIEDPSDAAGKLADEFSRIVGKSAVDAKAAP